MTFEVPPDIQVAARPDAPPEPDFEFWWYCLNENHPGADPYSQQPFNVNRIFGTKTDQGCPVCPACKKEVSAVPAPGPRTPPASVVTYAERFAASQIRGGIGR